MIKENYSGCNACQTKQELVMEDVKTNEEVQMNNNPVRMLFNLGTTVVDALSEYSRRGLLVKDEKKIDMRMETCSECKMFDKKSARCNICGCFMKLKIRLEASSCPVGKW